MLTNRDERKVDTIQEMLRLVQHYSSSFSNWGFKESYRSTSDNRLIYDSEWCRMKLIWGGWDALAGNSISIYYGRLHAPDESMTMLWNNEECHDCPAAEMTKKGYTHPLKSKYQKEEIKKKFYRRQPEWLMTMHMEVWNHYGKRFFELFDLRRPNLWEQYRKFLKEVYDIEGRIPF